MRKMIPQILQIVGLILVVYGIYQVVSPEASVDLGIVEATAQDNTDAYTTLGIGVLAVVLGFFMGKKK